MRWRGGRGLTAAGVAVVAVVLAAMGAAVKGAHWPGWVVSGVVALTAVIAALLKPVRDTVASAWASSIGRGLERRERERVLVGQVTGGRSEFSSVREMFQQPSLLGIHQAIALPTDADASLPPELPLYIPRDLHPRLTTWIAAHAASGGFLVVSGPAAAGKTRALFEALAATVGDWPMFLPEDAAQVAAYLESSGGSGPLVVWLNELYDFLGPDGLRASTVRRMLASARPILLVGTIWPERYSDLAGSGAHDGRGGARIHQDAREILTVLAHREHLAAAFSEAERELATKLARDPRIATALAYPSPALAASLAAAPALIAVWQDPDDPYRHAVLVAAVIARRCGHPPMIPAAVLEPVALAQLSPRERAAVREDWFKSAIEAACAPLPEVRVAALHPASTAPGSVEGYEVSDILVQHDRSPISDTIWRLVINHAAAEACLFIAVTAYNEASRIVLATQATRKAAEAQGLDQAPKAVAAAVLGALLDQQGDAEGARAHYRFAVDSGHNDAAPMAAVCLGALLNQQGDGEGAHAAYQFAIESGHKDAAPMAAFLLGCLLLRQEDTEGAQTAYQLAVKSSHNRATSVAAFLLGCLLLRQGDAEGAQAAYQIAIKSSHEDVTLVLEALARLLLVEPGGVQLALQVAMDFGQVGATSRAMQVIRELPSAGTAASRFQPDGRRGAS